MVKLNREKVPKFTNVID